MPTQLTAAEIREAIADFATAAENAIAAGFDGVEIHGANGYLVHQFLSSNANRRTDAWGTTTEGRIRFADEVASAVAAAIGPQRTGIRLLPGGTFNDIREDDVDVTYRALVDRLASLGLAYLHVLEGPGLRDLTNTLRSQWPGTLNLNPSRQPTHQAAGARPHRRRHRRPHRLRCSVHRQPCPPGPARRRWPVQRTRPAHRVRR